MKVRQQAWLGIKTYTSAIKLLFSTRLGLFLLAPIVLNIIFWFLLSYVQDLMHQYIESKVLLYFQEYIARFGLFKTILSAAVWLINKLIFFVLYGYVCGYLILLFLSPILSIVSEQTEKHLTGKLYNWSFFQFIKDCLRGILLAFRNGFLQTLWWLLATLVSILLFFIPGLGFLLITCIQIFLFVITCYFYGFSFIDYSMERRKLTISSTVKYARKHKGLLIGNGFVFAMVLATPFCGSILAGFVAIVSVVAATISVIKIEQTERKDGDK